ncbi:ABC transporter substrate-binding protein [Pseudonocardia sp. GCM10023141]|uniref:ABC transporter substrate-binding protein n=1 Tax=Pseudonocardia sp. GCM10023141 TaxID=3252653 RepID=UPI00362440B4
MKSIRTSLVGALALTLAACGSVTASNGGSQPGADSAACASTSGVTDTSIKLAAISDLSGPVSSGGIPFYKGLDAYLAYANEKLNTLGGRKVDLDVQDSAYDTQKALSEYRAVRDSVAAVPLAFGSAISSALAPLAVQDCMAVMSNAASVAEKPPNIFYLGPTIEDQVINALTWYVKTQNHPGAKVALLAQSGASGDAMVRAAQATAQASGFTVVATQTFAATDKTFAGQIAAIQAARPDVVLMGNQPGAAITFFGEAQAAGATWDWLGTQGAFAPTVFRLPISQAFQQKVVLSYGGPIFQSGGPAIELAQREITARHSDVATDPSALVGWEAGLFIYGALTNATKSNTLTRGGITAALGGLSIPGVGTPDIKFDSHGVVAGVPFHATAMAAPDASVPGGLKVVAPYSAAEFIPSYYAATAQK